MADAAAGNTGGGGGGGSGRPTGAFLDAIGNTPLLELKSLSKELGCTIYGKAEFMNPGMSVKDRAAKWMVETAEAAGDITPGVTTLVEGTGGNTGIALALVANAKGYKCTLVLGEHISKAKVALMRTYGASVVIQPSVAFTEPEHYHHTAIRLGQQPNHFHTNQFANVANSQAHIESTGPEIWRQTDGGKLDAFTCASGTGGTLGGVSSYLKERSNGAMKCYLTDPHGSSLAAYVLHGEFEKHGSSCITEGVGIGRLTNNQARAKLDGAYRVNDREISEMMAYLLRNEGLFCGPSAALNVCGAVKIARALGKGARVATVLCDTGIHYQDRAYNAAWMAEKELTPVCTGTALDFVE